ncbi:MAG: hypothetical protein JXB00_04720 [Bacteroidales bacterium]|nr:hypothetical protein [Bacteroidales bacterium]
MYLKKKEKIKPVFPKVIIILAMGFGFKLFFSCSPYSQSLIEINYNHIRVEGIDNSGRFMDYYNTTDTFYSDAVALKLTLSDTSMFYAVSYLSNALQAFSFWAVRADDISPAFIPRIKVTGIKVTTLLDINDSIKAGDDISGHILSSSSDNFVMYHNIEHAVSWLNGIQNYENSSIVLILKTSVKNTTARFDIVVTLENGDELLFTTSVFSIIES